MALQWIDAPQGRLRVDDGGAGGLPIVLVHGLAASLTVWKHQLPHLRRYRRAVAYDLRGMGESAPPRNGDYSLAGMAEDLDAVAGALGLERFVLAGHSYAGAVVGTYAAAHALVRPFPGLSIFGDRSEKCAPVADEAKRPSRSAKSM